MSDTAVTVIEPNVSLGVITATTPSQLVARATEAANVLASVIEGKKLYTIIRGRKHVWCEGWTTLAAMLGVTPHEVNVVEAPEGVFTATVELRRLADGRAVGRGSAECGAPDELDKYGEPLWAKRPRYARRSMALTRATAKACRLTFSWVMTLAGFDATPAEEMPREEKTERPARNPTASRMATKTHVAPTAADLSGMPDALKDEEDAPPKKIVNWPFKATGGTGAPLDADSTPADLRAKLDYLARYVERELPKMSKDPERLARYEKELAALRDHIEGLLDNQRPEEPV